MAADFGLWELRIPSSRAVYEDEDEEDVQATDLEKVLGSPSFNWLPSFVKSVGNSPANVQCSLLILGVGEVATSFLHAHLLSAGNETIGLITEEEKKTNFDDLLPEENMDKCCLIHRLNASQGTVICQTNMHVPAEKSFNWTCKVSVWKFTHFAECSERFNLMLFVCMYVCIYIYIYIYIVL